MKYTDGLKDEKLRKKLEKLEQVIGSCGRMAVALSGGVDSVFLLVSAGAVLGEDRVEAFTADAAHFPEEEARYAAAVCGSLGIRHRIIDADSAFRLIRSNPADRCYICKREIFTLMKEKAGARGSVLADGTNVDDMEDYRPGYEAVRETGTVSPLLEAGFGKKDIREALRFMAGSDEALRKALVTDVWNKPAAACLASRIPYNEEITGEKLAAAGAAERFLRDRGIRQVRVRCRESAGGLAAMIETGGAGSGRFREEGFPKEVCSRFRELGFKDVFLDLEGYRTGSLNAAVLREYTEGSGERYSFSDFREIIRRLRAPGGCPWDREQTHESLRKHLREESEEAVEAIDRKDDVNLCEELGDVLLQVVLHAQIASERGAFTMDDVVQTVSEKMIRRHPHVFGDVKISDAEECSKLWQEIKRREKEERG